MKTPAALVLALTLATGGCAHSQHTSSSHSARNVALTAVVVTALVLATTLAPCTQCNDTFVTTDPGAHQ